MKGRRKSDIYTHVAYLAKRKNKILSSVAKWMILEISNETARHRRENITCYSHVWVLNILTHAHTCANKHVHMCTYTCTHMNICAYILILTFTSTQLHLHTYTHTYTYQWKSRSKTVLGSKRFKGQYRGNNRRYWWLKKDQIDKIS